MTASQFLEIIDERITGWKTAIEQLEKFEVYELCELNAKIEELMELEKIIEERQSAELDRLSKKLDIGENEK